VRRRESDPDQIDGGDGGDAVIFRARIVRLAIAAASGILALLLGAATTYAQQVRIPNSEMPGRERYRFVDPPAPKSQPGEWLTPAWSHAQPPLKRRHGLPSRPKR
jgi:hypothetical protein